ncbi:MAG: hypothetical protein M5U11_09610 [Anaerolineales bacterium]|nr:hypothetical protein [Anaerolineales bacterium]MDX9938233.1 hypothetical protein [Anaerolineales bacterium]GER80736.1 hypothetical protein DIM_28170 [Candidatus Denitrolinea symbiosum]
MGGYRTYQSEILTNIYEKYHSPAIRQAHKKVWAIYRQIWLDNSKNDDEASMLSSRGEPITIEMARAFLRKTERTSEEYIAIDSLFGLWTYIMMLVFQKALDINQLSAFATPRILGLLYPIDEAKASLYGYGTHSTLSLKRLYECWKNKYPKSF